MSMIADSMIADLMLGWEQNSTESLVDLWRSRREDAEIELEVTEALKKYVEGRGEVVVIEGAECIETFKGTYAWEKIAHRFNPTVEQILEFTKVEWNKLAEKIAPSKKELDAVKSEFYDQGSKFFQLRLKKK